MVTRKRQTDSQSFDTLRSPCWQLGLGAAGVSLVSVLFDRHGMGITAAARELCHRDVKPLMDAVRIQRHE